MSARWWRRQSWNRLGKLLPAWILAHLELYRPVLLSLDQQIRALTVEVEKAAPAALPKGMGALSSVVISREICNWERLENRRQVSSYTGLCPGEYHSGVRNLVRSHGMEMADCAPRWSSWRGEWCAISPNITRCKNDSPRWHEEPKLPGRHARKPLSPSLVSSLSTSRRLHTGRCTGTILGFK